MKKDRILIIIIVVLIAVIIGSYIWFNYQINGTNMSVASVDNKDIMQEELQNELNSAYGKEVLSNLIDKKVMAVAKEKYEIKIDSTEIDRQYNEMMKGFDSEESFLEYYKEELGMTKEQLLDLIENNNLLEQIATKDVIISDEEIAEFYEENKNVYVEPESYHIQQIVVRTKEEAQQVVEELNNGSDFNTLAKEKSIDVLSASKGGDLGNVVEAEYTVDSAIINNAKTQKLNELSIVKLQSSYVVMRVLEHNKEIQYSLDEVKQRIRRELALRESISTVEVMNQLKSEFNVKIYDETLK